MTPRSRCLDGELMADSSPDSSDKSALVGLKNTSTSLFGIPGFFVGFGAKGTSETDSGKSPTSPLDFGVLANFGGLFSPRSPASSSPRNSRRKKWCCDKVGLSILNSFANDTGQGDDGHDDSFRKENIVLSPRIKIDIHKTAKLSCESLDSSIKSNSLPKNYAATSIRDSAELHSQPSDSNTIFRDKRVAEECSSVGKPSSSPMDIISSRLYSRSLSAREVTLSEDYTCIISHGPNPKTTHIFGDCILDCDPKELVDVDAEEELENPEDDTLPNAHGDSSNRICSCRKDGQSIQIDRFGSQTVEIPAEEGYIDDALVVSPGSSYH